MNSLVKLRRTIWKNRRELSLISVGGYATLGITFLLQVAIARLLGTDSFGVYSLSVAMVSLAEVPLIVRGSELAIRGLGESLRSEDGTTSAYARRMVVNDIRLFSVAFVFLIVAAWGFNDALGVDPLLFTILAATIPAQAGLGVYKTYFSLFNQMSEMVRYELTYTAFLVVVNVGGVLLWGLYGLAASMVIATLAKTYLAYWFTRKYLPVGQDANLPVSVASFGRDGVLSIMRNLFANGLNQVDVVVLGHMQRPEIVGLYRVGKSLASLPIKVSFPVWRYVQPRLIEALQTGDRGRERKVVLGGAFVLVLVMAVLLVPLVLFGEAAMGLLYGDAYRPAFRHFLILVVGVWAFHGVTGWFKVWVVATKSQLFGVFVYAGAASAVVAFGTMFGAASPVAMAWVVSTVLICTSLIAFAKVFR